MKNQQIIYFSTNINNIQSHWGYYLGGSITIVLFFVFVFLTIKHLKSNKENYYQENYSKIGWFINFLKKNKFQIYVFLDVIFLLCSIAFFLAGSGQLL